MVRGGIEKALGRKLDFRVGAFLRWLGEDLDWKVVLRDFVGPLLRCMILGWALQEPGNPPLAKGGPGVSCTVTNFLVLSLMRIHCPDPVLRRYSQTMLSWKTRRWGQRLEL